MLALWYHQMAEAVPAESVHKKTANKVGGLCRQYKRCDVKAFLFFNDLINRHFVLFVT